VLLRAYLRSESLRRTSIKRQPRKTPEASYSRGVHTQAQHAGGEAIRCPESRPAPLWARRASNSTSAILRLGRYQTTAAHQHTPHTRLISAATPVMPPLSRLRRIADAISIPDKKCSTLLWSAYRKYSIIILNASARSSARSRNTQ